VIVLVGSLSATIVTSPNRGQLFLDFNWIAVGVTVTNHIASCVSPRRRKANIRLRDAIEHREATFAKVVKPC